MTISTADDNGFINGDIRMLKVFDHTVTFQIRRLDVIRNEIFDVQFVLEKLELKFSTRGVANF